MTLFVFMLEKKKMREREREREEINFTPFKSNIWELPN